MTKPIVYIASPYSNGDSGLNVHFQCRIFDQLLSEGKVIPVAPLWSHFQHMVFPRLYTEWIQYDQAMLHLYDCCLRLNAEIADLNYSECTSQGADAEVASFNRMKKPVFLSIPELYQWVDSRPTEQL